MKVGIDRIGFYIPQSYLALSVLADRGGIDREKFSKGIGQEKIAIPQHCEDVVTMAAEAAYPLIEACGVDDIDTLMFATETGIDQSKSAGIYVHRLLGLSPKCRNVEVKQACYSATFALQSACAYVARKPDRKVLVIASDIARYDFDTPGEATQGAGAVAMIVSANPKIMSMDVESGLHSEDVMDFWRPNYRKTPLVDGKYSAIKYLHSLAHSWNDYRDNGGRSFDEFSQFCYHLPFSRMAEKAHKHLSTLNGETLNKNYIIPGMEYNREIGNCYTASLYLSLISMLENVDNDLAGKAVGLFSYGSGASAEFFSGVVEEGYKDILLTKRHRAMIEDRDSLSYDEYRSLCDVPDPENGENIQIDGDDSLRFCLEKIENHKRCYGVNKDKVILVENQCEYNRKSG